MAEKNDMIKEVIPAHGITFRDEVLPGDRDAVRSIVTSSGFFSEEEIDIAVELVDERLAGGEKSGYYFIFAEIGGTIAGYSSYGPIACTKNSYDLYWIAVDEKFRGGRIGTELLKISEKSIALKGGRRIYVETSSRSQYEPTRKFYEKRGYFLEAEIKDFYDLHDSKQIYTRVISVSR